MKLQFFQTQHVDYSLHRVYRLRLERCAERLGSFVHEHLLVSAHSVVVAATTAAIAAVVAKVVRHVHVVIVALPLVAVHTIVRLQRRLDVGVVRRQSASNSRQAWQSLAEELGIISLKTEVPN